MENLLEQLNDAINGYGIGETVPNVQYTVLKSNAYYHFIDVSFEER